MLFFFDVLLVQLSTGDGWSQGGNSRCFHGLRATVFAMPPLKSVAQGLRIHLSVTSPCKSKGPSTRNLRRTPHPVRDNKDYIRTQYTPTIPLLQGGGFS